MKFALILMIKNEEKILKRCLDAVKDLVDCYCIFDTGSTDNTVEIAKEYLKTSVGCIEEEPFRDFGYSRTQSFLSAQTFIRDNLKWNLNEVYGLLLDADMMFIQGTLKQQNLTEPGYRLIQKNGSLEYYNARIIRMDIPWKCIGVTHEYWDGPCNANLSKEICFIDDRNDGGCKHDKYERDQRLLEEGLRKEPDNGRYMFYLAQTLKCIGKHQESIDMYKKRIVTGGWAEEVWYSYYMIAECYLNLKDIAEFENWSQKAFLVRPQRSESIYKLARFFREIGHHYKCYEYIRTGEKVPFPKDDVLFIETDFYRGLFQYEKSIVEFYIHPERCLLTTIEYMLKLPHFQDNCVSNLKFSIKPLKNSKITKLMLPSLFGEHFTPSAISLNTYPFANVRYVNYLPPIDGGYRTRDGSTIQTKNAYINLDTKEFSAIEEPIVNFQSPVEGLEDLRLYTDPKNNKLSFTATSFKQFIQDKIAIVHGEYDLETKTYKNYQGIQSPTNSDCEKNWVNIPGTDDFIYSWNPLQIGKIRGDRILFHTKYDTPPLFSLFRGSAPPIDVNEKWLTLVHFVEYCQPRKYYHCFVELEKETYKVLRVSLPFVFNKIGIEYCISVRLIEDYLEYFVSFTDTNPSIVQSKLSDLEWIEISKPSPVVPKLLNEKSKTTFVTALIDLNESRPEKKDIVSYLKYFENLANTNLPFHVFISSSFEKEFKDKFGSYKNIYYEIINLEDLEVYKELSDVEFERPSVIVENTKQTTNYNKMNNSKIEFVKRAIDKDIYNINQYAWIDFGIDYVIKNKQTYKNLINTELSSKGIVIPTIWNRCKQRANDFNHINWRFCGGFFIGDKDSLIDFYNLYRKEFKKLISDKKVLPCEASIWSYFEEFFDWKVKDYTSDHNDTMLQIPTKYIKQTKTTFVTALINPNEVRPESKSVDKYFENFKKLVDSGISLHVFLSECYIENFNKLYSENPNIYVETIKFEDLLVYKEIQDLEYELPKVRCLVKDTENYMIIIHSKIEFLQKAISKNIFMNEQFAWIDFGIGHIMQNKSTLEKLATLNIKPQGIYAPSLLPPNNQEDFDNVNWRFPCGIYIGDKESLTKLCKLYFDNFKKTIQEKKILTWEANYWQYLEYKFELKVNTYSAGFNDSMIFNI
jgi:tetratricopeptide (TPR) repeat protein